MNRLIDTGAGLRACTRVLLSVLLIAASIALAGAGCGRSESASDGASGVDSIGNQDPSSSQATSTSSVTVPSTIIAPPSSAGIHISFKQDQRITQNYQGENWVSPATFTVIAEGDAATVVARVQVLDSGGRPLNAEVRWTPSVPDSVEVAREPGGDYRITLRAAGQSLLRLEAGGYLRELKISATQGAGSMRVDISQ